MIQLYAQVPFERMSPALFHYMKLWSLLLLSTPFWVSASETEIFKLAYVTDLHSGFQFLWAIPKSKLETLPKFSPTETEAPISPHKAAIMAISAVQGRMAAGTRLSPLSISLDHCRPKEDGGVWAYHVLLTADPQVPASDRSLLRVFILLDGSVVPAEVTPVQARPKKAN
jgi:hypothetical protein